MQLNISHNEDHTLLVVPGSGRIIKLDNNGWAIVEDCIGGMRAGKPVFPILCQINLGKPRMEHTINELVDLAQDLLTKKESPKATPAIKAPLPAGMIDTPGVRARLQAAVEATPDDFKGLPVIHGDEMGDWEGDKTRMDYAHDPEAGVTFKASGGNRSKNLEAIADGVDGILGGEGNTPQVSPQQAHQIRGWMEQVRIIADELAGKRK